MLFTLLCVFALEKESKKSSTELSTEAPPPPSDLYSSSKWCPKSSALCVSAAASKELGLVDMQLEFSLEPNSYVAIGFGGNKMENSDMLVITNQKLKNKDAELIVEDFFSKSYTLPTKDKKQDYEVLAKTKKKDGKHVVIVRRKIDTGDAEDHPFPWNKSFDMIWARGKALKELQKHTEAGSLEFKMSKFDSAEAAKKHAAGTTEPQKDSNAEEDNGSASSKIAFLFSTLVFYFL